jgi:hypothetical protein
MISTFRLWLPEGGTPKNVLLLMRDSGDSIQDFEGFNKVWQNLAREQNLAVVTCSFEEKKEGPSAAAVEEWSGKMFLDALKKLAAEAGKPELAEAPLLMAGSFGRGSQFVCNFTAWKPERVLAVSANEGRFADKVNQRPACQTPFLFTQEDKKPEHKKYVDKYLELMTAARRRNAPWCFAGNVRGGQSEAAFLGANFFTAVLQQNAADKKMTWLGNLRDKTITPADGDKFTGTKDTVWLPDEDFAHTWQLFVSGKE